MVITSACGAEYTGSIPVGHPNVFFMKKKLLLISISAGSGHMRAAEAVKKEAVLNYPEFAVEHIDMMDYINSALKKTIIESYALMAKKLPELYGFFYKKTDTPKISHFTKTLSNFFNQFNCGRFFKYIKEYNPDHILCTHFLSVYALQPLQKNNNIKARISILTTDYYSHDLQIIKNIDHYFVSNEKISYHLIKSGIEPNNITESGIPVDSVFYQNKLTEALKKSYHIMPEDFNILILSGGKGLVDTGNIIKTLFDFKKPARIIAISGENRKLQEKLNSLYAPTHISLEVIGWTDKIDEYMRTADVIISKPGGLTTTECIVLGKPLIAISPIPGQEEYNACFILENNFGVVARNTSDLIYYLDKFDIWSKKIPNKKPPSAAKIILDKLKELS